MRILLLGCGNIGALIALDLVNNISVDELVLVNKDIQRINRVLKRIGISQLSYLKLDVNDYSELVKVMKTSDLVIGALPGRYGFKCVKAAIEAGVNMVDISYMPENILTIHSDALRSDVTIVPDMGIAPGLSNLLVGHAVSMLDLVNSIHIYVGGLPEKRVPPLDYIVTWSIGDLIDEYLRRPKIISNGKIVEVDALSGLEELNFPGVGKLEAFYTDGLRTLLHTVEGVRDMWEKTLRYPGHVEKIRLLRDLGFFSESPINSIIPRYVTEKILEKGLKKEGIKDLLILVIKVTGYKDDERIKITYQLIQHYDEEHNLTAMAKATAYPASIVSQLMVKGVVKEKGIIPPEKLGANDILYEKIIRELSYKGINVSEKLFRTSL